MMTQQQQAPLIISESQFANLNSTNGTAPGVPPFAIRNITQINANLSRASTQQGFVNLPIYTYADANTVDRLSTHGCPYARTESHTRGPLDSSYTAADL